MLPLVDSPAFPPLVRGLSNGAVFIFALILLERSADVFVDSTAAIARRFSVPIILVGLLTAGAEWEELAVVVSSLVSRNPSLALSNIYGSFTANILGSFSIGLLFDPGPLSPNEQQSARIYSSVLLALVAFIALLSLPGISGQFDRDVESARISKGRLVGVILLASFVIYVMGVGWAIYRGIVIAPEDSDSDSDSDIVGSEEGGSEDGEVANQVPPHVIPSESTVLVPSSRTLRAQKSTTHHVLLLVLSTLILSLSGYLLSSTASSLAALLALSQSALGVTLLSVSTTLPEKIVAFKAGAKRQTGVLVANTVGSNVFLGTLVLGVLYIVEGRAVYPHKSKRGVAELVDTSVMLASAVLLSGIVWLGHFHRWVGVAMLVLYVSYLVAVVIMGIE